MAAGVAVVCSLNMNSTYRQPQSRCCWNEHAPRFPVGERVRYHTTKRNDLVCMAAVNLTKGAGHLLILLDDSSLYTCGMNRNGQLGRETSEVDYGSISPRHSRYSLSFFDLECLLNYAPAALLLAVPTSWLPMLSGAIRRFLSL